MVTLTFRLMLLTMSLALSLDFLHALAPYRFPLLALQKCKIV